VAKRAVEVIAGFGVNDEHLAASLDIEVRELVGLLDHQVGLEGAIGAISHRRNHIGTERQIRNESTIHNVELESIDASFVQRDDFVAKPTEVCGEDRWDDGNRAGSTHATKLVQRHGPASPPPSVSFFGHGV
jgi:hypothetical protein